MTAVTRAPGQVARDRALWALAFCGVLGVLLTARWLEPSPAGVGTHEQLGLPACGVLRWLGIPCPACGLTTSFAHLARFEVERALAVHPLGLPLFVLALMLLPVCGQGCVRGASLGAALARYRVDRWALGIVLAALVVWIARLAAT